jgi:phosphocarrier protein HPr
MKEFQYVITDPEGIHARPAGLLVKTASQFESAVTIEKDGKQADAKRIFAVMGLAAKQGQQLTVKVDGADEDTAASEIERFLKENM